MIETLTTEITKHNDRAAILPIHRLQDLRQDVEDLKGSGELNNFQQYILTGLYQLDLPDTGFEIRSILLVAAPSPPTVNLTFTWQGKSIPVMLPASYADKSKAPKRIENYLREFLNPLGYHVRYAPQLPHKLTAVRSGLGRYGRNNICFVEGMGSFLNLSPYFTDIPCTQDTWREIRAMDQCDNCRACLQNCPTGAILPARFLIDNQRCLTYFNEAGGEWDFPAWIDPAAHHTLYGCLRCQTICPVNKPYLNNRRNPVEFNEEETSLLLEGEPFDRFPEDLRNKVESLEMKEYLSGIPRNLRVLFTRFV